MGDHHSGEFRVVSERLTDPLHQAAPMGKLQISTIHIGDLLQLKLRQALNIGHRIHQRVNA